MKYVLLVLAVLIVPACGSSNGNSSPPPPPVLPAAVVPEPIKVLVNQAGVVLDGSKSHDNVAGAPPLTYLWQQTSGTAVTLSSATVAAPTFTAPAGAGDLVFKLTVTGAQGSDSASVTVTVKSFMIAPVLDQWFVGYGNSGNFTPVVQGTPPSKSPPTLDTITYSWSGIPAWLTANQASVSSPNLTFTAPQFADVQNFEDIPGVAVLERTAQGRVQFTLTMNNVTAGTVLDQVLVNFSVGPFANTVANENVALGNAVFLNGAKTVNGAAITSWTWVGIKPDGTSMTAAADFKTPDKKALSLSGTPTLQRFVYFVPDQLGTYQIQITQTPGPVTQVVLINCGKYVGIGNQIGTIPDPFKGECAACHAGQLPFVANFADPWKVTQHAHVFEQMVDPANPVYGPSQAKGVWRNAFDFVPPVFAPPPTPQQLQTLRSFEFSIDQRTVGFSRNSATLNGGWTEPATAEGFALPGATWSETIRKTPKTAALSNTQCESCHGPGSEHAGDTTGIRKSFDSMVCGRCHAQKEDVWEASAHADRMSNAFTHASGSASCNGCHTAQGFVVEMNAQQTADPHPVLYAVSNVNRPVIAMNDRRTQTCQTCHDPHQNTIGLGGANPDPQLRCFGNVQFRNGATTNAGRAAVCYMCHQSRTDTTNNSADMNGRRGPHDSTAAEMLAGKNAVQFSAWANGYAGSPHGDPSRFVSPNGEVRQCLACHNDKQPDPGTPGYGALGGHSFNMTQGTGAVLSTQAAYSNCATLVGTKKFTVTGGPSLLKSVFPGDTLLITSGADSSATAFTVASVDSGSQLTLNAPANFAGAATFNWSLTSTLKYNTAACVQCHTTAPDFRDIARGDYDGDGTIESVQDEIGGLLAKLNTEINNKLASLLSQSSISGTYSWVPGSRISYTLTVPPAPPAQPVSYVFPGPSVTSSQNPQISWASLGADSQLQKDWLALYQAAYNWMFVSNDNSHGIHNTGYAVNLLQSSIKAVNPAATVGAPFVPFP